MGAYERMAACLPAFYPELMEIGAFLRIAAEELDLLADKRRELHDGLYVRTASGEALSRLEKLYGITDGTGYTEEERRARLLMWAAGRNGLTGTRIRELAVSAGAGRVELTLSGSTLEVAFVEFYGKRPEMEELIRTVSALLPAHVALTARYTYATQEETAAYTYGQLAGYTHEQIRLAEYGEV